MKKRLFMTVLWIFSLLGVIFTVNAASVDWSSLMTFPTEEQIRSHNAVSSERAPYASSYYSFSDSMYNQFCVDFKMDYFPEYTYVCPANWWMSTDSVKNQYLQIGDYIQAYAGFQNNATQQLAILSIWDTEYTDLNGNRGRIHARPIYYKTDTGYLDIVDEGEEAGTFSSCRISYSLNRGQWYRMLLQCGISEETGNTTIEFWIQDCLTNAWDKLMVFDLGIKDISMSSFSNFLECYSNGTSGDIRTMELTNARASNTKTGVWENVYSISSSVYSGAMPEFNGSGSYSFSSDGSVFRVITSGVSGLGEYQGNQEFRLTNSVTGSPF
ncbi:MAG: DUF3472 domain-containing protein [Clostridiales bacterium]|nr:DUF3472 domain-containing protein [Candidatus Blautia equi]